MKFDSNAAAFIATQAGCCPLVTGVPGVAKTEILKAFAKATGRNIYILLGSIREPVDIAGIHYPVTQHLNGHTPEGVTVISDPVTGVRSSVEMHLVPPKWASDCHNGEKWIVMLDELTTCPPAVQAAMLRVIAERCVGDLSLPEDTWLFAAANPSSIAANGFQLEPPMANRLVHLDWKFPWESFKDGLRNSLDFPQPHVPVLPDDWQENIPEAANLVAAYCEVRQEHFTLPTDSDGNVSGKTYTRARLSKAWPSPRSWTALVKCWAAAKSVGADDLIVNQLFAGCVGDDIAIELREWIDHLDLPNPEDLLTWAKSKRDGKKAKFPGAKDGDYKHPARADQVIAMLGSVSQAVRRENTAERWECAMDILWESYQHQKDVTISCGKTLAQNLPPNCQLGKDVKMRPEMSQAFYEVLKKTRLDVKA